MLNEPACARPPRSAGAVLVFILVLAFASRLALHVTFRTIYYPDEIFQTVEPAYRLVTGHGVVTWEWREGIRSWLVPGFLAAVIAASIGSGLSHALALDIVTAALVLVSLASPVVAYLAGRDHFGNGGGLVAALIVAAWPDLVYFAPKALSEVIAAHVLVVAAYLATDRPALSRWPLPSRAAALGLLLGLTCALRFHLAPALLVVAASFAGIRVRDRWLPLALWSLLPLAALAILDWLTLGLPLQSVWKNVLLNLYEAKSSYYGTSPWYMLLVEMAAQWQFAAIAVGVAFFAGVRCEPAMALAALTIIAVHSAIPHKEFRFIYPAIPLLLIVASMGALRIGRALAGDRPNRQSLLQGVLALGALALCWTVATSSYYRHLWHRGGGAHEAQQAALQGGPICGIGIVDIPWTLVGGYSRLPIPAERYWIQSPVEIKAFPVPAGNEAVVPERVQAAFNVIFLTPRSFPLPAFGPRQCFGDYCVARREGGCVPDPQHELNRALLSVDH